MEKAKIIFRSILLDAQNYASFNQDDDIMVSVIKFDIVIGSRKFPNMRVEVKQPYGTNYESEPLEVGPPSGYNGPWNHSEFAKACEQYYRNQMIGSSGPSLLHFSVSGSKDVRMRDVYHEVESHTEFDLPETGSAAWNFEAE